MVPSYDPELRLVYIGTSVTSPAPKFFLGDVDETYLHHNSTLALEHRTGDIRWAYQHLNDHWDLDHVFARLLVDTEVAPDPDSVRWINPDLKAGQKRKVMTGVPGKTGLVYTLDRETGEFLWATPTIHQNVITDIDPTTGRATPNDELIFREVDVEMHVCPSLAGGTEAGVYSPLTNTLYYPLQNTCMDMIATNNFDSARSRALGSRGAVRQEIYSLLATHEITPGADNVGTVRAISAETGATQWLEEYRPRTPVAGRHRRWPALRRRLRRPLPRARSGHGEDALGDQPRCGGRRLPDHLQRRRTPVRRGHHRRRLQPADAGDPAR